MRAIGASALVSASKAQFWEKNAGMIDYSRFSVQLCPLTAFGSERPVPVASSRPFLDRAWILVPKWSDWSSAGPAFVGWIAGPSEQALNLCLFD